ncbi:FMN-binding split barrel-related protein [Penicillium soppii]|uniref:FMN-binding split barrel-related protein n=1 Tax=Penicillium soppii TaxID=69789 RepID=UPI0025468E29|nr:FMN-binding split barrel-related protein [Penicillium soppii]KAJ5881722.1 FMN-binding split barrel-related protein [Penicillium soppii]
MHLRPDHAIRDLPTLHAFIKQHPLGVLTTSLPSENHPTLQCSHIPWVLDSEVSDFARKNEAGAPPHSLGTMRGHIARQNPQAKAMVEASESPKTSSIPGAFPTDETPATNPEPVGHILPGEVLIVFTSPVDHYITPNFYPETKPAGRVAPTWNYAAVQVYGRATIYHDTKDPQTEIFLRQQLSDLAKLGEEGIMGFQENASGSGSGSQTGSMDSGDGVNQGKDTSGSGSGTASPTPWKIADAPLEYIATLLKNLVGMRIDITRIEGRFKVSQEKGVKDRGGVVEGLEGMGSASAKDMAEFVRRGRGLA